MRRARNHEFCTYHCEVWNQPIVSKIEDKLAELRAAHTIFVSAQPRKTIFRAGEDDIPPDAEAWAGLYGFEVSGTNSLKETRALTPGEEYIVDPLEDDETEYYPKTITVTVRLAVPDSAVTTMFNITLLRPDEPSGVARLQSGGGYVYYPTLQGAIGAVVGPELATIEIVTSFDIDETVNIQDEKHIKLIPADTTVTLTRGSGFTDGSLFTVESGGVLTLAGSGGGLVLDGGKNSGLTVTAALVTVSGGALTMKDGVTLQNNNNSGSDGGGLYVADNGMFTAMMAEVTQILQTAMAMPHIAFPALKNATQPPGHP